MFTRLRCAIQDHRRDLVLWTLFFLVAIIGFAAGFLSARGNDHPPIILEKYSALL